MSSHHYHQEATAPPMYPDVDNIRPIPPVRSEFARHPQEENLLPPKPPERMDKPSSRLPTDDRLRRVNIEIIIVMFLKYRLHNYETKSTFASSYFLIRMIMRKILVI